MGNKKKIAKFLREEGKKLPVETYEVYNKYFEVQFEEKDGEKIPVFGEIEKCKVNHGRRLKRLYMKHGKEAVDAYFNARGFKLVNKDERENMEASEEPKL